MADSIGIIGFGRMGRAIGETLARGGHPVSAWSRSGAEVDATSEHPVMAAKNIATLVAASDIIILSLLDDDAVHAMLKEVSRCDLSGKLIVETSTVSPETLRAHVKTIEAAGGRSIDAPISGGPDMIAAGRAGFYIGGEDRDVARFRPMAEKLSDRILHVGPLGHGAAAKIVNNMMLVGFWQCLKEAIQIGKQAGLKPGKILEILSGSPAASPAFKSRLPVMTGESDAVGFTVAGAVKDARLVRDTAKAYEVAVPAMLASLASFETHLTRGFAEADLATMIRAVCED